MYSSLDFFCTIFPFYNKDIQEANPIRSTKQQWKQQWRGRVAWQLKEKKAKQEQQQFSTEAAFQKTVKASRQHAGLWQWWGVVSSVENKCIW